MLDIIEQISVGYQRKSDTELLDCPEYQEVVKARLCVMVTKLTQLTRVATRASATLTTHLIPPLAISGLLMGLSAMSFVYLGNIFGYWCYFQNFMWCISSVSTLIMYAHCGQKFENLTEDMFDAIYNIRWSSFNESNRKIILITMIMFQEPKKLRFTDTVSCNYELGVRIAKGVYSFAAVMARLSSSQESL
ncbi:hypothetical protein Zmor_011611 [Zophobas morio]|uniref:Uncharacterized protein n=1 Tax=Zophobas morio TaxID=2755281 RepID=A0AA38ML23_9CUCU|nr:hypothetical protein Zmor_011611 [Zophobas morio]